jgi:hypothetical protein
LTDILQKPFKESEAKAISLENPSKIYGKKRGTNFKNFQVSTVRENRLMQQKEYDIFWSDKARVDRPYFNPDIFIHPGQEK